MDTKCFFIRDVNKFPVACVVSCLVQDHIYYAYSIHNPIDGFDRKMARHIAAARLAKLLTLEGGKRIGHTGSFSYTPGCKPKQKIMQEIAASTRRPQVLVAIALWLEKQAAA